MAIIKVKQKFQITLPNDLRKRLRIKEGDYMKIDIQDDSIILKHIDKDQAWWWTEEWQKMEKQADEAIKKAQTVGPFDNIQDALKALKGKG